MDTPEVAVARYAAKVSLWALYCSGGSLIVAAALLALEIRRRLDEGVKLAMTIMQDGRMYGGIQQDEASYLVASVTNRGSAPTTITHLVLFNYPNQFARWLPKWVTRWVKSQRPETFLVTTGIPAPPPFVLEPGRNWMSAVKRTPELAQKIESGNFYVGVIGSHSDKTLVRRAG